MCIGVVLVSRERNEASISPNRHTDINSVDELISMIKHIRDVTGRPVGFKSVIGASDWLDDLFERVNVRWVPKMRRILLP